MEHLRWLAIGLSLVFGCLLLALIAEVYYLLWWRRRRLNSITDEAESVNESSKYAKNILHLICLERPSSLNSNSTDGLRPLASNGVVLVNDPDNGEKQDLEMGSSKSLMPKDEVEEEEEESVDAELMRLHNLAGPPRFLTTIAEETREDMESDDGRSGRRGSSRGRSLSDIQFSPLKPGQSPNRRDSSTGSESEFRFDVPAGRSSSPPPKFKFLRDAEEKLLRRLMEEAEKKRNEGYGSLLKIGVVETKEIKGQDQIDQIVLKNLCNFPSSSSQVLPLASSPTANFRRLEEKLAPFH